MTTFTGQVSQSTDDGGQLQSNTVNLTAASTAMKNSSGFNTWWACRFQNVTIPPGATIVSATLSIWCTTAGIIQTNIYGNKVANPGTLQTTTSYISGLAQTTATVVYSPNPATSGAFNALPDISAIITELIGQAGWASGNAMLFIMKLNSGGTALGIEDWDGNTSEAAKISITYTLPASGGLLIGVP